mmetsp:Transcript_15115/g.17386  ORF Transcript_15115/g.17386 Transcript_15115/m.17386 type:complete len:419 (-) Transcript_15115:373-1629(-)
MCSNHCPALKGTSPPLPFPEASIKNCDRISQRIYDPKKCLEVAANDVLVPNNALSDCGSQKAYWLQRTLRKAIYGKVRYGLVLRRTDVSDGNNCDWTVTGEECAVKEMDWNTIKENQNNFIEDPIGEVNALNYLASVKKLQEGEGEYKDSVLVPIDILTDQKYLYSILPFCNGGELFERLVDVSKFTEVEARYWMKQLLKGLHYLQSLGVCHRDVSLENVLVHDNNSLIIDLGMCLLVPFSSAKRRKTSHNSSIKIFADSDDDSDDNCEGRKIFVAPRIPGDDTQMRYLMPPQGQCGKWNYMSPEIHDNTAPFDGFAVDLWAAGVMLFMMVTGFPPFERPHDSDDQFRFMADGHLVDLLNHWKLGLSTEVMDLLQGMLYGDPKKRLCLNKVMEHPWLQVNDKYGERLVNNKPPPQPWI